MLPGGCTKGELTLVGQQQALDLGAWLRRRYVQQLCFLPPRSAAGAVSGRTTNYRSVVVVHCCCVTMWSAAVYLLVIAVPLQACVRAL